MIPNKVTQGKYLGKRTEASWMGAPALRRGNEKSAKGSWNEVERRRKAEFSLGRCRASHTLRTFSDSCHCLISVFEVTGDGTRAVLLGY